MTFVVFIHFILVYFISALRISFTHTYFMFSTELLSSWESLLHWSENESFVKQSQEEMATLVDKLNKIGTSEPNLDTESSIQFAIQEAKVRKISNFLFLKLNERISAQLERQIVGLEKGQSKLVFIIAVSSA